MSEEEEEKKEDLAGFDDNDGHQEDIKGHLQPKLKKGGLSATFEKALDAVENMNKDKLH